MIAQCECATFSKSLNPRNIDKSVSDIRFRIRFPFESKLWISVSGCKLTILPDIQPANRIVIISGSYCSPEVAIDPECRSRLRQDSAFFLRTRIWDQKFVKNRTEIRNHFSFSAIAGVHVVFISELAGVTFSDSDCTLDPKF